MNFAKINHMKTIEINKPILDACCAGRMFYFNKKDPRVLFQDIRDTGINLVDGRVYSIHPDIKGDFTNMQFPDESFSMVILTRLTSSWKKKTKSQPAIKCKNTDGSIKTGKKSFVKVSQSALEYSNTKAS